MPSAVPVNKTSTPEPEANAASGSGGSRVRRFLLLTVACLIVVYWQRQRILSPLLEKVVSHHLKERDPDTAQWWASVGSRFLPESPGTAIAQARIARYRGDMPGVATALKTAAEQGASMDLLNREQWLAMAQCGQMRDAEPHLGELLTDRQFDNRDVCEAFVIGYIRNHRPAVARTLLDPWIADHPNDATPLLLRARILRLTGLPKESEQDFLAAIKMKPHWTEPRLELAELLIDRKRFDDAREYFQELMTDDAFYVRVRIGLAECLAAEGNSEQAEQVLQQASRFDPKSVHAWQALGRTLLENGKYKDAIQALEKALELRPHDDETNYLAGQAFSLNGQRDQADQYFQNVETARAALAELDRLNAELLVEANDPQKLIRAGEIMLRYGDPTEGVLLIHSGLDINPGDIKGLRLLAEHYASRAAEDFQYQTLADDFEQKLQDAEKSAE